MTDPYIDINTTKLEFFDNEVGAVRTLKQLDDAVKLTGNQTITGNKFFADGMEINTGISGTACASGAEVTAGTNGTKIVTAEAIGAAGVNTRLKSKIITATRDLAAAGGDVSYTGLDFTPTSIQFSGGIGGTDTVGHGFADSTKASYGWGATSAGVYYNDPVLVFLAIDTGNYQKATVKTYDANVGLTLTWTKTGSPTGTAALSFLCFR